MNKISKVLFVNVVLIMSLLFSFQNNISYCQSYDKMEALISNQEKEGYLKEKINTLNYILDSENESNSSKYLLSSNIMETQGNVNNLKMIQIKILNSFFKSQLNKCKDYGSELIKQVEEERLQTLKESNVSYIKGGWPLEKETYISSPYGYRIHPISKRLSFHTGIDIPAPKNTNVLASDDGIVSFASYKNGYGNLVKIKHFDGKVTVYAHNNTIVVKSGDIVKKGTVISKVGSTGNSTGNHLHFEVIINNERINPLDGVTKDI
ncbi:MAG: M23 family metallopeptidase [Terrisporobacter sp.]|uniref:M23 family metallopeptidase n=1 Tax=Terrisporobacter sp. TaxID=1965305 RepID=UPI002FCB66E2